MAYPTAYRYVLTILLIRLCVRLFVKWPVIRYGRSVRSRGIEIISISCAQRRITGDSRERIVTFVDCRLLQIRHQTANTVSTVLEIQL